jgi:thermostable 8-oxoguanine DNA glycosylase
VQADPRMLRVRAQTLPNKFWSRKHRFALLRAEFAIGTRKQKSEPEFRGLSRKHRFALLRAEFAIETRKRKSEPNSAGRFQSTRFRIVAGCGQKVPGFREFCSRVRNSYLNLET